MAHLAIWLCVSFALVALGGSFGFALVSSERGGRLERRHIATVELSALFALITFLAAFLSVL